MSHEFKGKKSTVNFETENKEERKSYNKIPIEKVVVWKRLYCFIRIQDLKPSLYDEALNFIQNHYFNTGTVCQKTGINDDAQSKESYSKRILSNMTDSYSFVALDERDESIYGVLVFKLMSKKEYKKVYHEVSEKEGKSYYQLMKFFNHMNRQTDIFDEMNCVEFLEYHLVCVLPEYFDEDLDFLMMISGMDLARYLQVKVLVGIFDTWRLQDLSKYLGLKPIYEIDYADYDLFPKKFNQKEKQTCGIYAGYVKEMATPPNAAESR